MSGRIPLVDLAAQHAEIAEEVDAGFRRVMTHGAFILGMEVAAFEQEFARYCSVENCIGVGNGTDALELILRALQIGAGDEVILPVNTFIATALAVARTGALPVFVDSDPVYYLMDPSEAAAKLSPRTRALIAVDLYGQIAPMAELRQLTDAAGVALIEDAAQAHGARQHGTAAGAFGVAAGTSFYPGKNLGAYGDGGAVLTRSAALADKIRALRNYGSDVKYHHPETGFNSRLDTLHAVVLGAKLQRLTAWNAKRREAAARYDALLGDLPGLVLPRVRAGNDHVWHLYVVRVPDRDRILQQLTAAGVGAGVHYPVPIHLQGAFRHLGYDRGAFPIAERVAGELLSLPMYPHLTEDQQMLVAKVLRRAFEDAGAA